MLDSFPPQLAALLQGNMCVFPALKMLKSEAKKICSVLWLEYGLQYEYWPISYTSAQ